jgi:hypothetical protein
MSHVTVVRRATSVDLSLDNMSLVIISTTLHALQLAAHDMKHLIAYLDSNFRRPSPTSVLAGTLRKLTPTLCASALHWRPEPQVTDCLCIVCTPSTCTMAPNRVPWRNGRALNTSGRTTPTFSRGRSRRGCVIVSSGDILAKEECYAFCSTLLEEAVILTTICFISNAERGRNKLRLVGC